MRAEVVSNSCIRGAYYKLTLEPPQKIKAIPGQFLMIRPGLSRNVSITLRPLNSGSFVHPQSVSFCNITDPLLPRPFSVHQLNQEGGIEILYKVVGKGTTLLSYAQAGEELEILGPFGNGFDITTAGLTEEIAVIAGGIGVAPLLGLIEAIKTTYSDKKIISFLGGRTESDLICAENLKTLSTELILTTNDGSAGSKGYITEAFEKYLYSGQREGKGLTVYACGPAPMLHRISELAALKGIETFFSLEATMACGMGLCMGCAVRRKGGGYYLVCKDGPVFRGDTVDLK